MFSFFKKTPSSIAPTKTECSLTIRDERDEHSYSSAQVEIKEDGTLVFEGVDGGAGIEKLYGDSDFEYWLQIKAEDKNLVLLHLIKSQFTSVHDFKKWLVERGIKAEFSCY